MRALVTAQVVDGPRHDDRSDLLVQIAVGKDLKAWSEHFSTGEIDAIMAALKVNGVFAVHRGSRWNLIVSCRSQNKAQSLKPELQQKIRELTDEIQSSRRS